MKINYIGYLRKEKVIDPKVFPDMPDEQAEQVYCELIKQVSRLLHHYHNFTMISLVSILGILVFASIFVAVDDISQLQKTLILIGFIPCCGSWIYSSVGVYVLTYRQAKVEKSLKFIENEHPAVEDNFSNEIIFHYNYDGRERISHLRAWSLSLIASPVYALTFLGLERSYLIDSSDRLSSILVGIYLTLIFVALNFLYVRFCKQKSKN